MKTNSKLEKIALFGNFGTGNLGNEATLKAMVQNLQRLMPSVQITCICPGPEKAASDHHIAAIPMRAVFPLWKTSPSSNSHDHDPQKENGTAGKPHQRIKAASRMRAFLRTLAYPILEVYRWLRGISALRGSNLLVMTGTGMLGDYAIRPLGLHYDIFRWAIIAKLCGCKVLFVSVGGGPVRHPLSRYFVKVALSLADYRSYRDIDSKNYLEAFGAKVKDDTVYPDLAFSLQTTSTHVVNSSGAQGPAIGVGLMNYNNRVGLSINDDKVYLNYLTAVALFIMGLLKRGYSIRILIGDVVWDQGVRHDLRKVLEDYGSQKFEGKIIDESALSVDELLSQLASVDLVVSSRFHNLVLALTLHKPVIAISYHEKFKPLMSAVGLDAFYQDIEQIDVKELIEKVATAFGSTLDSETHIAQKAEQFRIALDEQYARIIDIAHSRNEDSKAHLVTALFSCLSSR